MASQGIQPAKLVLLGDMGAGKSSLVLRFVKGQFTDYQVSSKEEEEEEEEEENISAFSIVLRLVFLFKSTDTLSLLLLLLKESTIGAAFLTKTVPEFKVKFEIWVSCFALLLSFFLSFFLSFIFLLLLLNPKTC